MNQDKRTMISSSAIGNTHFPSSDLNNLQIADLMFAFLHGKKPD